MRNIQNKSQNSEGKDRGRSNAKVLSRRRKRNAGRRKLKKKRRNTY